MTDKNTVSRGRSQKEDRRNDCIQAELNQLANTDLQSVNSQNEQSELSVSFQDDVKASNKSLPIKNENQFSS